LGEQHAETHSKFEQFLTEKESLAQASRRAESREVVAGEVHLRSCSEHVDLMESVTRVSGSWEWHLGAWKSTGPTLISRRHRCSVVTSALAVNRLDKIILGKISLPGFIFIMVRVEPIIFEFMPFGHQISGRRWTSALGETVAPPLLRPE
jgi:hypothetical protein